MTTTHGWTGSPAIRAAVQSPPSARAGVVVCPPIGQEGVIAYRTLRLLADRLEARGMASVRYDPSGRGDGAVDADPLAPVRSARRAAHALRATGVTEIAFVGLASGALVAAEAAGDDDALLVWDAPESGRAWLRRQRALATITIGPDRVVDDLESLVGVDLDRDQAQVLGALGYAPRTAPTVALVRPGLTAPKRLGDVHTLEVLGSAELLDGTSIHARIPGDALETAVAWLDAWAPLFGVPVSAPPLSTTLDVSCSVTERLLTLGPERLFAVETVSAAAPDDAPVVLLHNGAAEHRVGASDYQVDLARSLAADGARVVRVDRRGTGESSAVRADEQDYLFTQEWVDDQAAVTAALGVPASRLAVVGMCAGAWLAGRARSAPPRLVVEISPNDYRRRAATPGTYSGAVRAIDEASALRLWVRARYNTVVPTRLRERIARRDRSGGVVEHVRPLVEGGSDVVMIVSPTDDELFARLGGARAVHRWGDRVSVVRVADGDHSLFSPHMRRAVIAEVRSRVAQTFPARVPV